MRGCEPHIRISSHLCAQNPSTFYSGQVKPIVRNNYRLIDRRIRASKRSRRLRKHHHATQDVQTWRKPLEQRPNRVLPPYNDSFELHEDKHANHRRDRGSAPQPQLEDRWERSVPGDQVQGWEGDAEEAGDGPELGVIQVRVPVGEDDVVFFRFL